MLDDPQKLIETGQKVFDVMRIIRIVGFIASLCFLGLLFLLVNIGDKNTLYRENIIFPEDMTNHKIFLNESLPKSKLFINLDYSFDYPANLSVTVTLPDGSNITGEEELQKMNVQKDERFFFEFIYVDEPREFEAGEYVFNFEVDNPKTIIKNGQIIFSKVKE